jgi:hypothetical protein
MAHPFILYKLVKESLPVKCAKTSRRLDASATGVGASLGAPRGPYLDGSLRLRYEATIMTIHVCCRGRMMGMRPGLRAPRALMTG